MNGSTNDEDRVTPIHPDALSIIDDELSEDDIREAAGDEWQPTEDMVSYARVYVSAPPRATITEMAKLADIARKTVYCWRKSPYWRDWMAKVALRAAGLAVGRVWRAVLDRASQGDIRAAGMVVRRFDPEYRKRMMESEHKREPGMVPAGAADQARDALE